MVTDILMPLIGLLLGGADFSNLFIMLGCGDYVTLADAQAAGPATLNEGLFINAVVHVTIIAAAMFAVVQQMNWRKERNDTPNEPTLVPETKSCTYCVSVIPESTSHFPYCTSALTNDGKT